MLDVSGMVRGALLSAFILTWAPAQADVISCDNLIRFIQHGTEEAEIVRLVEGAAAVRVNDADFERLKSAGAGKQLLDAIAKRLEGDVVSRVIAWTQAGKPETEILDWVLASGKRLSLSTDDKKRLFDANVTDSVIRAIQGTYVPAGFKAYQDPLGFIALQCPEKWNTYRWFTKEGLKILISPESSVNAANQFRTGLQIQLSFLALTHPSRQAGFDPVQHFNNNLPQLLRANRAEYDMKSVGSARSARLSGYPAVEQDFTCRMMGVACRETLIDAAVEDVSFFIEAVAPDDADPSVRATMTKMLSTACIFPDRTSITRRPSPASAVQMLEKYREAVVAVVCKLEGGTSFGTGFFVREDGYILTNHHVICGRRDHALCSDSANWELPKSVSILWDGQVPSGRPGHSRKEVPATIVDSHYMRSPTLDVALLKVAPEKKPYKALPVATLASGLIKEGDPIVALGFPLPGQHGIGNLFTTDGAIVRVNYIERAYSHASGRRDLNDLLISAVINKGNSGGPCVDLMTGCVIGLNTYNEIKPTGEKLEYSGVVVMDHVMEHFPQIRWYTRGSRMGPTEHLELGTMLSARGNHRAAQVQFDAARKAENELDAEQRARLHYGMASVCLATRDDPACEQFLDQSLEDDPDFVPALSEKARVHAIRNEFDKAMALADRTVSSHRDSWSSHYLRAEILWRAGQSDDALTSLKQAMDLGGDSEPSVHILHGLIYAQAGNPEKSLKSYREAARLDPSDFNARVLIAQALAKSDPKAALAEWGRVNALFPGVSHVREQYGRFLLGSEGRFDEAVEELNAAVVMAMEQDGRVSFGLLADLSDKTIENDRHAKTGFVAAVILAKQWPQDPTAHDLLTRFWRIQGHPRISAAHATAAHRLRKGPASAKDPLLWEDVKTLATSYVGLEQLAARVLSTVNLGWTPTLEQLRALPPSMLELVFLRWKLDQMDGGSSLARSMKVTYDPAGVNVSGDQPWVDLTLTNEGLLPLRVGPVREFYIDRSNKTLGTIDTELNAYDPIWMPNDSRRLRYVFSNVDVIANKTGVAVRDIPSFAIQVPSAVNAWYLQQIKIDVALTQSKCELTLTNQSPFTVGEITVSCIGIDARGAPVLENGRTVRGEQRISGILESGEKTAVSIPGWVQLALKAGGRLQIQASNGVIDPAVDADTKRSTSPPR